MKRIKAPTLSSRRCCLRSLIEHWTKIQWNNYANRELQQSKEVAWAERKSSLQKVPWVSVSRVLTKSHMTRGQPWLYRLFFNQFYWRTLYKTHAIWLKGEMMPCNGQWSQFKDVFHSCGTQKHFHRDWTCGQKSKRNFTRDMQIKVCNERKIKMWLISPF